MRIRAFRQATGGPGANLRTMHLRASALFLAVVGLAVPGAALGAAAPASTFGLKALGASHGYFMLRGRPGEVLHGRVRVVNAGRATGAVLLQAADATTGQTTGVVYDTRSLHAAGTWVTLDRRRLSLPAGHSAVVGFAVHVAPDAAPGDHLGGIVAVPATGPAPAPSGDAKHAFQVRVVEQSIVAVEVAVPGAASRQLALTGVRAAANPGFQTLLVGLRNTGGRLLHGKGTVRVLDGGGATIRHRGFIVDTMVPGTGVDDPLVLRGPPLRPGQYVAVLEARWAGGQTTLRAPFTVSLRQLRQVYGSRGLPALGARGSTGSGPGGLLIAGGVLALLLLSGAGAAVLHFRRRTRELSARLARQAQPAPTTDGRPDPAKPA